MGFLDKAKAAAEQAANKANEAVGDVQTKRELTKVYAELGEKAYALVGSGAISHPELQPLVDRARELHAKLDEEDGGAGGASGASETAGAGAAAATADASAPLGGNGAPPPGA
jgi:hypothetical protein